MKREGDQKVALHGLPYLARGFGIPPAEALACKIPCIVADIPVLREVYGNHVEYFQEHDVDELARVMERLLADAPYRAERGQAGSEYIKSKYTWRESAAKIERITMESG